MYARVTTFKVDPARLQELSAKIEEMGPRAKALPGMVDAYAAWRGDGQGVVVAIYRSKEDADRGRRPHPGPVGRPGRPAERRAEDRRLRERRARHGLSVERGRRIRRRSPRPDLPSSAVALAPRQQQLLDLARRAAAG